MKSTRQIVGAQQYEQAPGHSTEALGRDFLRKLYCDVGKFPGVSNLNDHFLALALAVRERMLHRWVKSAKAYLEGERRTVCYLSAEYMPGPQLGLNLMNLGMEEHARQALNSLGLDLDELLEHEGEPGLGNGGLGRLAACFMESMATLCIPAIGYGIRYEFGIFSQEIRDGWQVETADQWLRVGNPWEIHRYLTSFEVGFGGKTQMRRGATGRLHTDWFPDRVVRGVPYDTPLVGRRGTNTNFLRLWSATAVEEFDLDSFQVGDYRRAVSAKVQSENIAKILYPNDQTEAGRQLRLEQQYFLVSCSLQDMIRLLLQRVPIDRFADKFAIQLNDTHPALAIPELMRLLMDVYEMDWDRAWSLCQRTFSYTNHTLLSEAMERWPVALLERVLPRHLEIIYEINRRFLDEMRGRFPGDEGMIRRLSIIGEGSKKVVRMAHLATVGSHTVNGVAELHSELLKTTVLNDLATAWPKRFTNVTNGVSHRRFLGLANPRLTQLIEEKLGHSVLTHPEALSELANHANDEEFAERWRAVKRENKSQFSHWLRHTTGALIDPSSLYDVQCKRIHEYKRQLLALLHLAWLFTRICRGEDRGIVPRTFILAGKAAPSYATAKLIIRFAHGLSDKINNHPVARELLRIVFVPNFNVKRAQHIYPAADLSEQISTAGREASGTGNMKFALNGALTIGTLDGANVEIRERVGAENFFLFGLTAPEVLRAQREGRNPRKELEKDPELQALLDEVAHGRFGPEVPGQFEPLVRTLLEQDQLFVIPDFRSYEACHKRVRQAWGNQSWWTRASILNTAAMGHFSSDRSIAEYAKRIWHVDPVIVNTSND